MGFQLHVRGCDECFAVQLAMGLGWVDDLTRLADGASFCLHLIMNVPIFMDCEGFAYQHPRRVNLADSVLKICGSVQAQVFLLWYSACHFTVEEGCLNQLSASMFGLVQAHMGRHAGALPNLPNGEHAIRISATNQGLQSTLLLQMQQQQPHERAKQQVLCGIVDIAA